MIRKIIDKIPGRRQGCIKQPRQRRDNNLLSVVIGSYNRLHLLRKTIESVRTNEINIPFEMIVIDGGSTDGSMEWLCSQKDIITVIQHNRGEFQGRPIKRRSWGYFMNLGFKSSQGKYVLMLSDDCLLLPGAVTAGLMRIEALAASGRKIGGAAFYFRNWPKEKEYYVQRTLGGMLMVNHGIFLSSALEEVGWADEETYMFYKADGDLCLKIWQSGYEIVDCSGAYLEHYYNEKEEVRKSNNDILERDRHAYGRRWKHLKALGEMGRIYSDFVDKEKTAEKTWGP